MQNNVNIGTTKKQDISYDKIILTHAPPTNRTYPMIKIVNIDITNKQDTSHDKIILTYTSDRLPYEFYDSLHLCSML